MEVGATRGRVGVRGPRDHGGWEPPTDLGLLCWFLGILRFVRPTRRFITGTGRPQRSREVPQKAERPATVLGWRGEGRRPGTRNTVARLVVGDPESSEFVGETGGCHLGLEREPLVATAGFADLAQPRDHRR